MKKIVLVVLVGMTMLALAGCSMQEHRGENVITRHIYLGERIRVVNNLSRRVIITSGRCDNEIVLQPGQQTSIQGLREGDILVAQVMEGSSVVGTTDYRVRRRYSRGRLWRITSYRRIR